MKLRPSGPLDAMGRVSTSLLRKRAMIGRVPIPCGENWASLSAEMFDVGVDNRNQIIAFRHSHSPAREQIILRIHEEEDGVSVRLGN